jgi:hypothetical protein
MDGHDGEEDDEDAVAALFMGEEEQEFGDGDDEDFVASQDGILPITSSMGASSRTESPPQGQAALLAQILGGGGPATPTRDPEITLLGSIAPTAFEHDEYLQLVVERSDGQLIGAVPVRFDVGSQRCSWPCRRERSARHSSLGARTVAPRLPQSIASPGGDRAAAR